MMSLKAELFPVWRVLYADGTSVIYAFDVPMRPISIDHKPDKECEPYWVDFAITASDGRSLLAKDKWDETSKWKLHLPADKTCTNPGERRT